MVKTNSSDAPDDRKFMELVLFIAQRSEGDSNFGATKLNKLLFYSDFLAYANLGRAITNHRYQRLPKGPAPRAMLPILKQMESARMIARAERTHYGKVQKRVVALRDPDLSLFSAQEIMLVTDLISEFHGKNATDVSEFSHRFRGWQLAEPGEDIPYQMALVRFGRPTDADRQHALAHGDELKALAMECSSRDSE